MNQYVAILSPTTAEVVLAGLADPGVYLVRMSS